MTFSLVITTYNRPAEVQQLVQQALECNPSPQKVIVVDSSDKIHPTLPEQPGVIYIRSSHKNQPYQRLLGAKAANTDIVVFLDDDLKIVRKSIFAKLLKEFNNLEIFGVSMGFDYQQSNENGLAIPDSVKNSYWTKVFWRFTCVPKVSCGEINRLGIVGAKPTEKKNVYSFSGAVMVFKKEFIDLIIPKELLSLYECNLGKGEDKIISMLASKYGKLLYLPEVCLFHPPNDSNYFQNVADFAAKVLYSRLYLSRIYAEVVGSSYWKEVIIFHWFALWRWIISGFLFIIHPSRHRWDKWKGITRGWWLAITLPQKVEKLTPGIDWDWELQEDLNKILEQ